MNLMAPFGKSLYKTGCMRPSYEMIDLLVGIFMKAMLPLSKVSGQAGFFMTGATCLYFYLRLWFGKQPDLIFGSWGGT